MAGNKFTMLYFIGSVPAEVDDNSAAQGVLNLVLDVQDALAVPKTGRQGIFNHSRNFSSLKAQFEHVKGEPSGGRAPDASPVIFLGRRFTRKPNPDTTDKFFLYAFENGFSNAIVKHVFTSISLDFKGFNFDATNSKGT